MVWMQDGLVCWMGNLFQKVCQNIPGDDYSPTSLIAKIFNVQIFFLIDIQGGAGGTIPIAKGNW